MQYCGITFEGCCYVKDNDEKHHPDPAGKLPYASPSMVAAFQWPMSLQSMVGAEKTAQREVSHLCNMSGSASLTSHRDTLVPGALTTAKSLSQVVSCLPGSPPCVFLSHCYPGNPSNGEEKSS